MNSWIKRLGWLTVILLVITTASFIYAQNTEGDAVVRVIIFHSPTCPHCRMVVENTIPELEALYGNQLEVRLYNLMDIEDYEVFRALNEAIPDTPTAIPQAYIRDVILVGSADIPAQLPLLIDACLAEGGCDWSFTFSTEASEQPDDVQQPVYMAFVYDSTCLECDRVSYDLNYLSNQYPYLEIRRYDVKHEAAFIDAMGEAIGVPDEQRLLAPAIYIGDTYLEPDAIEVERLQVLIETASVTGGIAPWERVNDIDLASAEQRITERFSQFSLLTIAVAGLLDGLNPCAFTTIIFFVSYLTLVGRQGREILIIGSTFTFAVFLTYLAMGLGLSAIVERMGDFSLVGKVIYSITALICLTLAAISFYDWVKIRRGQLTEIVLQLPKALKDRIHVTIRKRARMAGYVGAAFSAGILVSVFELACTGQVYLPTIVFMTTVAEMRLSAVIQLILYNLMFVLPLIAVFMMTFWGTTSKQLTDLFQKRAGLVKLLTTGLFAALGLWLLWIIFV